MREANSLVVAEHGNTTTCPIVFIVLWNHLHIYYWVTWLLSTAWIEMGPRYSLPSYLLALLSMYISIHGVISSIELTRYILRSQEKPVSYHITVHTTVVSRPRHCVFLCNRHPECIASHVTPDSVCTMYGPDLDSPYAITLHTAVGKTYIHGK